MKMPGAQRSRLLLFALVSHLGTAAEVSVWNLVNSVSVRAVDTRRFHGVILAACPC